MKPPKTYEALLAFLLLILGGVFTLLGLMDRPAAGAGLDPPADRGPSRLRPAGA